MNTVARVTIFGAVFLLALVTWVWASVIRSPYMTDVNVAKDQPVPFSHKHHVGDIGIDCRYCHTSVEDSPFAGIPPTETCMNCHSQLWADSPMLEPVRASYREGKPLVWNRVHDLPDYAYFNHSIHISKGVACAACHGDVATMPLMYRKETLHMEWCLQCHRNPEQFVGPRSLVFSPSGNLDIEPSESDIDWVKAYHVTSKTNCSACHH